jgi:hypothetical protein
MQTSIEQLKRQQEILKALNFYSGKIDGIWGPVSIKAMHAFEVSPQFLPGHPHNGMPMYDKSPYPAGIVRKHDGLLHHPAIDKQSPGHPVVAPVKEPAVANVEQAVQTDQLATQPSNGQGVTKGQEKNKGQS